MSDSASSTIRVGVDVGGTFTDVTLVDANGGLTTAKVPTTGDQSEGVRAGIEKACDGAGLDPSEIDRFRHATTVSVNALLEGAGATTALVTTEGFRDVAELGRQDRPSLYDLSDRPPAPLVPRERRFEVDERVTPEGVEQAVDPEQVRDLAARIPEDIESVAVSLLHAYAEPANERVVTDVLREELAVPVSASHEVLAEFREYDRTATTTVDAYVRPTIEAYLSRLTERAADAGIPAPRVMQSNGGIADAETVRSRAVTSVLSGPAAGVVGARAVTDRLDRADLVTFDMGGTSSDVSLIRAGAAERTTEATIDGRPIRVPVVDVNTVGAGGGSIAWVDAGGALRVGPRSAGASPGPACYGRGGTDPTVTDAAVVLGYVGASTELGGELSVDREAAVDALSRLADEAGMDDALAAAEGVYEVANASMSRPIRSVTVERGHDPRSFGLVAFGGAGPMHAAALADRLDIDTVVVPRACGVLSAYGLLAADEKHDAVRTHRERLDTLDPSTAGSLLDDLREDVLASASDPDAATVEYAADLRYTGQSYELAVEIASGADAVDPAALEGGFHAAHERAHGYRMDEPVELVNLRATATIRESPLAVAYEPAGNPRTGEREARFGGEFHRTPVYDREAIAPGTELPGPRIVEGAESTIVVPPAWTGTVERDGTLVLERGETDA